MSEEKLPKWDLESIYSSVESKEFTADIARVYKLSDELKEKSNDKSIPLIELIRLRDELKALTGELSAYAYTSFSVNTTNPDILAAYSKVENASVAANDADTVFAYYIAERESEFNDPALKDYALFLE